MTNSLLRNRPLARVTLVALAAIAVAACNSPAPRETKIAAIDSTQQTKMPMDMPMDMSAGKMKAMCPLGDTTLKLTPAQKATFDSVRTEHHAAMEREMKAALARARAVLNPAQQAKFDSASAAHMAEMKKMMSGGGCME
jgi:hypothetical protein